MQRRSAVGRLAAAAAGLSLGKVPGLESGLPLEGSPFSVTPANLAPSSGVVTCPNCQETADTLDLTPAGLCLECADRNPTLRAAAYSDTFWALPPREVRRLELEIDRLAGELMRMRGRFAELQRRQIADGGNGFDQAMEAEGDRWHALQRELHLLHLLRAASRQFSG